MKELEQLRDNLIKERDKADRHDPHYHFVNEIVQDLSMVIENYDVLSQEWIGKNSESFQWHERMVPESKLQMVLVPSTKTSFKTLTNPEQQFEISKAYDKGYQEAMEERKEIADKIVDNLKSHLVGRDEETEVKDLQWMKDQLEKDYADGKRVQSRIKDGEKIEGIDSKSYWRGSQTANYIARCYLEDLDEPETLSPEWIEEHKVLIGAESDGWDFGRPVYGIEESDLQNLLVPKQE